MLTRSLFSHRTLAGAVLLFIIATPGRPLLAGPTNTATEAANAATNSNAKPEPGLVVQSPFVEPPVPEAVFVMPKGPAEGKDPFFPKSTLPYTGGTPVVTKTGPVQVVAELILRGISGTDQQPLAIINTTTFGTGDELDVTTKAGKLRIRCLEINPTEGTVSVQIGGERRLLRLPPAK